MADNQRINASTFVLVVTGALPHPSLARVWDALNDPTFTWNHNAVMAAGEDGLRRVLGDNVAPVS